eukprot:62257_1
MPGECRSCKKTDAALICSACKSAYYCNRECQVNDWLDHKTPCKRIRKRRTKNNQIQQNQNEEKSPQFRLPPFDAKLIRIEPIEEKGYGMIANMNIKKGTIIVKERPLISYHSEITSMQGVDSQKDNANLIKKLASLSQTQRDIYNSLSKNHLFELNPFSIYLNNRITMPEQKASGIFPLIARVNHQCCANAHWQWMDKVGEERLIARTDIQKDMEITASYTLKMPSQQRKMRLKEWNIECHCNWCTDPQMDKIIGEYCKLDKNILITGMMNPFGGYKLAKQTITLVEKHFNCDPSLMDRHCYDAAQFALQLERWDEAAYYLEEHMKQKQLAKGMDIDCPMGTMDKINQLPSKNRSRFKKFYMNIFD